MASATTLAMAPTQEVTFKNELMLNPTSYKYKADDAVVTYAIADTYTPRHSHDGDMKKVVLGEYYIVNGVRFERGDVVEIPAGTAYDSMFPAGATIACICKNKYFCGNPLDDKRCDPNNMVRVKSVMTKAERVIQFREWGPLIRKGLHKNVDEWNAMDQTAREVFKDEYRQQAADYVEPARLL